MATLLELRTTIADDLATGMDVTTAQIDAAIKAAIRDYESQRFWFNETRSITFPTVIGQSDYSSAANVGLVMQADYLTLLLSGPDRRMTHCRSSELAYLLEADSTSGEPYLWTWFGDAIRLFPLPDAVYTVQVTGFIKYAELSANSDTNVWTEEGKGYDLIRARAKWHIASNITKDEQEAGRAAASEELALDAALRTTARRIARGHVVPVSF